MPARVNNPNAAEALRREYTVQGDRLNLQIDDVVVPVCVVGDLTASGGIPTVRRAYAQFLQVAVVAEYPVWRLEVPSGFIAVVRRVHIVSASGGQARVHWGADFAVAPPNIAANTQLMDGRLRAERGFWPGAALVFGTQIPQMAVPYYNVPADTGLGIENIVEWLCGRTDGLYDFIEFQFPVLNNQVSVMMEWDEYPTGQ